MEPLPLPLLPTLLHLLLAGHQHLAGERPWAMQAAPFIESSQDLWHRVAISLMGMALGVPPSTVKRLRCVCPGTAGAGGAGGGGVREAGGQDKGDVC
jgi:hypothetical protein